MRLCCVFVNLSICIYQFRHSPFTMFVFAHIFYQWRPFAIFYCITPFTEEATMNSQKSGGTNIKNKQSTQHQKITANDNMGREYGRKNVVNIGENVQFYAFAWIIWNAVTFLLRFSLLFQCLVLFVCHRMVEYENMPWHIHDWNFQID